MKSYQKLYVCLAVILFLSQPVCAGLKEHRLLVGSGAKQIGMGSASTAMTTSSWNIIWNPSTLTHIDQIELSLFDLPLQPNSTDREGGLAIAIGAKQIGIYQADIGMLGITSWFDGWGDDQEKNRVIAVGYGFPINREFSAGMAIRHHRQTDLEEMRLDWSFDIGMLYSHKLKRLGHQFSIGAAINDIQIKGEKGHEKIPIASRLGIAYHLDSDTIFSCDIAYCNDREIPRQDRFRAYIGAERWLFDRIIGVRVGYTGVVNYDRFTTGEWARGFSLQTGLGEISYAYVSGEIIEPGRHLISVTLRWGRAEKMPEKLSDEIVGEIRQIAPTTRPEPILMPGEVKESVSIPYEAFSPNNDGKKDVIPFELNINESQSWMLEIKNGYDENVKTFTGTGIPIESIAWDGKDSDGNIVREGTYISRLTLSDEMQAIRTCESIHRQIIVDTTPPDLSISTEPLLIISQAQYGYTRENVFNKPKIHVRVSDKNDIAKWALEISDDSGNVLQKFNGENKPTDEIVWNNWEEKIVVKDEPQQFYCKGKVEDIAGNESIANATLSALNINKLSGRHDERGIVISLPSVTFDTDEYEVKYECHDILEEVAEVIKAYLKAKIQIEGHTDDIGDDSYNLELSKKRANAVMTYLVENFGIDPKRLTAVGYGETRPIASNLTTEGRQKNRRVDIVLLPVDEESEKTRKQGNKTRTTDYESQNNQQSAEDELPSSSYGNQQSVSAVPEKESPGKEAEPSTQMYVIQAGSFEQKINAETVVKIIEKLQLNYRTRISEVLIHGSIWYRVMLGEFPDKKSAKKVADLLEEKLGWETVIIPYSVISEKK